MSHSNYYESNRISRWWRKGLANMVRNLLPQGWEEKSLLDVGTGDGYTIRLVKPQGPVTGIDTDPEMADLAATRSVDFRVGSAYKIPFPDGTFDLVTCVEVIEHLERPLEALAELKRVTKKGGSVVMTTPVPNLLWRFIWWGWTHVGPGKRWENTPHVSEMRLRAKPGEPSLEEALKGLGFTVEDTDDCHLGMIEGVRAKAAV
ncbi:MAG TPA: class I SAM-dependent methyltransferase [Nitrososphaerales archaeon]|nr:class I SAM-dependent methyltransferase [Nitrososphaerales archaeon]